MSFRVMVLGRRCWPPTGWEASGRSSAVAGRATQTPQARQHPVRLALVTVPGRPPDDEQVYGRRPCSDRKHDRADIGTWFSRLALGRLLAHNLALHSPSFQLLCDLQRAHHARFFVARHGTVVLVGSGGGSRKCRRARLPRGQARGRILLRNRYLGLIHDETVCQGWVSIVECDGD